MELGAEISQKVKKTIKKQLQTLGCYIDDELPEYIMMMIANKRTHAQMIEDLVLFLNDEAEKFVAWLTVVLGRIQKAMELPDMDAIAEDVGESQDVKKKSKKVKKDKKISESEQNRKDDNHEKRRSEEQRRLRDSKGEVDEKEKEKRRQQRLHIEREKERKENERREKEHHSRMEDQSRSEKESTLSHDEEINKRRAAREKRDKEEKERREERKKKEKEQEENENRDKDKQRRFKEDKEIKKHESRKSEEGVRPDKEKETPNDSDNQKLNGLDDIKDKETDADVRKEAENEAKKIENRESRNPMEFVKRIAKDITRQIMTEPASEKGGNDTTTTKADGDVDFKKETVDNADLTVGENVSLQAVSQYEDGENDDKEKAEKGEKDDNKSQSRLRRPSKHRHGSSRSRSKSESKHHNPKESRSANKSRSSRSKSCERNHKHHHSRLRSPSKEKQERKSRKDREQDSSKKDECPSSHHSMKKSDGEENSRRKRSHDSSKNVANNDASKRKDSKSGSSPTRKSSRDHHRRRKSGSLTRRSNRDHHRRKTSNEGSNKINSDVVDKEKEKKEEKEEPPAKPTVASKVQVYTDFSRKPSLPKHNQASTVLLKRAVTDVVNKKLDEENVEDDIELDYNETDDESGSSDESNNDIFLGRRVINFDKEKSGLTTITVNFNKGNSPLNDNNKQKRSTRSNNRDRGMGSATEKGHTPSGNHSSSHLRRSDDKDGERGKRHIAGISENDARYAILRSRLEHDRSTNEKKVRNENRREKSSNHEKYLSSMVADLEEKSTRQNVTRSWRDQRNSKDSRNKQNERQRGSHRKHSATGGGGGGGESSGDEEMLTEEAWEIEMQKLSHSRQSDGDLRDLLLGKREEQSSSDEEDALVQRLREKIKEEKHKRLFGKLNSEDEDRLKRREERDNLRNRLNFKKKRRRLSENNESPEWIEKVTKNGSDRKEQMDTSPILRPVCSLVKPMCNLPHSHSGKAKLICTVLPLPPTAPTDDDDDDDDENMISPPSTESSLHTGTADKFPMTTIEVSADIIVSSLSEKPPVSGESL